MMNQEDVINQYDEYLKCVINNLANCWMNPDVGIVGAGIFDPSHPPVLATSKQIEIGKWRHAEVNALLEFKKKYGLLSKEAIIVVTLSPCIKSISNSRVGDSCTNFLRKYGATQIHTGIIDQTQGINNISEYKNYKLNLTLSKDQISKMICRNLYDIFRIYGDRVNYDLLTIKKELGNYVFQIPLTSLFQTSMNTISQ